MEVADGKTGLDPYFEFQKCFPAGVFSLVRKTELTTYSRDYLQE
jgi:hypothetical protein